MILIDANVLIWILNGDDSRFTRRALETLNAARTDVVVSSVSILEMSIKRRIGKLVTTRDPLSYIRETRIRVLDLTAEHADYVSKLPLHHGDPFDRALIAQAIVEGASLITSDRDIPRYDVDVIW